MPEYITKELAVKRSGRSGRRLLELAAEGRLRKKILRDPRNGNREYSVFHSGDIAALRQVARGESMPAPTALQVSVPPPPPAAPPAALPHREELRPWLTLAQAADYSGLPESFLRRLVKSGKLPALEVGDSHGHWRIARRDLDALTAG